MTTDELRELLERVEKHGGPVRAEPNIAGDYIVFYAQAYAGDGYAEEWCRLDVALNDRHADRIVGVLKRDLIERGFEPCSGYRDHEWWAELWGEYPYQPGDSELEALLKAWLAAAEHEGWSA